MQHDGSSTAPHVFCIEFYAEIMKTDAKVRHVRVPPGWLAACLSSCLETTITDATTLISIKLDDNTSSKLARH